MAIQRSQPHFIHADLSCVGPNQLPHALGPKDTEENGIPKRNLFCCGKTVESVSHRFMERPFGTIQLISIQQKALEKLYGIVFVTFGCHV